LLKPVRGLGCMKGVTHVYRAQTQALYSEL